MNPTLFDLPWGPANSYGTLILLGVLASMPGCWWDLKARKLASGRHTTGTLFLDLYLYLAAGVIVGGRALFVLTTPEVYLADPLRAFAPEASGFVFFGSFLGMALALWIYARRRDLAPGVVFDVVATWTPIAHVGGRLGCFLAGCCYGAPTDLPWGVSFPDRAIAFEDPAIPHLGAHTVPLHPAQLYEAAGLAALAAVLIVARLRRVPPPWRQASGYATGYGVLRLALELVRGDADRRFLIELRIPPLAEILHVPRDQILALSTSQIVSIALVAAGVWGLRRTARAERKAPTP